VWQELAIGLMEAAPAKMFALLRSCGALARVLPELAAAWEIRGQYAHSRRALDFAAARGYALEVRYATLSCALAGLAAPENELRQMSTRLRTPADARDLALLALRHGDVIRAGATLDPERIVALLQECDAWRRPARFEQLLQAVESRVAIRTRPFAAAARLLVALGAARGVDAGAIAVHASGAREISVRLRAARVAAVKTALAVR
jgi:tRNA nucleotidyltransferase (CCA-adding enzyme)